MQVETILAKRQVADGRVEYLIRWRGFDQDWDTWEPGENLDSAQEAVQEFNNRDHTPAAMATNRPARTIKPPSKFLDADMEIPMNGVPNHIAMTDPSGVSSAARKFGRSVSLTRDDPKGKSSPKRRASSIESSTDEETKSTGRVSRQGSLSPPAKVKPALRKGENENSSAMNGTVIPDKEVKFNNVVTTGSLSPGSRKQVGPKAAKPAENTKSALESASQNAAPSKADSDKGSNEAAKPPPAKATGAAAKGKAGTGVKMKRTISEGQKVTEAAQEQNTKTTTKKSAKRPRLNTKTLKTMAGKETRPSAKSSKNTATKVKRKYERKKAPTKSSESRVGSSESDVTCGGGVPQPEVEFLTGEKKVVRKVAKLATKPGKAWSFRKMSPVDAKPKLAVKRQRGVKPRPRAVIATETVTMSGKRFPSVEKTVRYKLDGTPKMKPGPKPKPKTQSDSSNSQGSTSNASQSSTDEKDKQGPKQTKKAAVGDGASDKSKNKSAHKADSGSDVGDSNKKPVSKQASPEQPVRKKPGPKPKSDQSEVKRSSSEGSIQEKVKKTELPTELKKDAVLAPVQPARKKPGPKPKNASQEGSEENPVKNKPGPKPKKNVTPESAKSKESPQVSESENKAKLKGNSSVSSSGNTSSPDKAKKKVRKEAAENTESNKGNNRVKKSVPDVVKKDSVVTKTGNDSDAGSKSKAKSGSKVSSENKVGDSKSKTAPANSPSKAKPGQKVKKTSAAGNSNNSSKSAGSSPNKPGPSSSSSTESPKLAGKKAKKKATKRLAASDRENSTSDDSDILYSLNEVTNQGPKFKRLKLDRSDSATSSDSEIVLKKPKLSKAATTPTPPMSPRKMLLKDSIRPKTLDNDSGKCHSLQGEPRNLWSAS